MDRIYEQVTIEEEMERENKREKMVDFINNV